jgi:hypothetical protein
LGFLFLCAWTAAAAVGLGWLLSFVGQAVYALVFFPAIAAMGLMLLGAAGVMLGKVRSALAAAAVALAAGVVMVAAAHYFDYLRFRDTATSRLRDPIKQELGLAVVVKKFEGLGLGPNFVQDKLEEIRRPDLPDKNDPFTEARGVWKRVEPELAPMVARLQADRDAGRVTEEDLLRLDSSPAGEALNQELDAVLAGWAGRLTFWDFLALKADQGDVFRWKASKLFPLSGGWLWAFWGVELLAGVVAVPFMAFMTGRPFCGRCRRWKEEDEAGRAYHSAVVATRQVKEGEAGRLAADAAAPTAHGACLGLYLAVCPVCRGEAPVDVRLVKITRKDDKEEEENLAHVTYPGSALAVLQVAFPPRKPT